MTDEEKRDTEISAEDKEEVSTEGESVSLSEGQEVALTEAEIGILTEGKGISKPKLDKEALLYVCLGIAAVFCLMFIINGFIFKLVSDQKTAYYFSILASNILFMTLILVIKAVKGITWAELGWKKVKLGQSIKDILKVWGLTWLIHIAYMIILVSLGITPEENELAKLLQKPTLLMLLINILIIAVAAPMIEETLFRGILFGSLRTYCGYWTAIVISAAIFSALHFELIGFVPRFVLGIGLGYLYIKHQSIFPSMGLHALNNLLAVIIISVLS